MVSAPRPPCGCWRNNRPPFSASHQGSRFNISPCRGLSLSLSPLLSHRPDPARNHPTAERGGEPAFLNLVFVRFFGPRTGVCNALVVECRLPRSCFRSPPLDPVTVGFPAWPTRSRSASVVSLFAVTPVTFVHGYGLRTPLFFLYGGQAGTFFGPPGWCSFPSFLCLPETHRRPPSTLLDVSSGVFFCPR